MASAESSTFLTEEFPFDFDWTDIESVIQREEPHGSDLCHDYEQILDSERSEATSDEASEMNYEKDAEYITDDDMDLDDDRTQIVSIPSNEEVTETMLWFTMKIFIISTGLEIQSVSLAQPPQPNHQLSSAVGPKFPKEVTS